MNFRSRIFWAHLWKLHDWLICIAFCLSVRLSVTRQKVLDNNSYLKKYSIAFTKCPRSFKLKAGGLMSTSSCIFSGVYHPQDDRDVKKSTTKVRKMLECFKCKYTGCINILQCLFAFAQFTWQVLKYSVTHSQLFQLFSVICDDNNWLQKGVSHRPLSGDHFFIPDFIFYCIFPLFGIPKEKPLSSEWLQFL